MYCFNSKTPAKRDSEKPVARCTITMPRHTIT